MASFRLNVDTSGIKPVDISPALLTLREYETAKQKEREYLESELAETSKLKYLVAASDLETLDKYQSYLDSITTAMEAVNLGSLSGARDYAWAARRNYAENVVPMQEAANTLKEHLKARLTQASAGKNVRYATPQLTIGTLMNNPGFIDELVDLDKEYTKFATDVSLLSKAIMESPEYKQATNGQYIDVTTRQGLLTASLLVSAMANDDNLIASLADDNPVKDSLIALRELKLRLKATMHYDKYSSADLIDIDDTLNRAYVAGIQNTAYNSVANRGYVNLADPSTQLLSMLVKYYRDHPKELGNIGRYRSSHDDEDNPSSSDYYSVKLVDGTPTRGKNIADASDNNVYSMETLSEAKKALNAGNLEVLKISKEATLKKVKSALDAVITAMTRDINTYKDKGIDVKIYIDRDKLEKLEPEDIQRNPHSVYEPVVVAKK